MRKERDDFLDSSKLLIVHLLCLVDLETDISIENLSSIFNSHTILSPYNHSNLEKEKRLIIQGVYKV